MKFYVTILLVGIVACSSQKHAAAPVNTSMKDEVKETLRELTLREAAWAMQQDPITITAQIAARSAGGKHDFFSEGDYWWPNPESADSPYVQRDGMTNP